MKDTDRVDGTPACMLCGTGEAVGVIGENTVFEGGPHICFCETCLLYFLGTPPSPVQLEEYYTREYYASQEGSGIAYALRARFSRMRAWSQYLFLRRIMEGEGSVPGGTVLEAGSSYGTFLAIFRQHGWSVRGLEFSDFAIRKARELHHMELEQKDILEMDPEGEKFDLIVMSHVLEHMTAPIHVLKHCARLLTPRGRIFIEVPVAPLRHECGAEELIQSLNTTHLFDFRPESLAGLAKKAGFEAVAMERFFYCLPGLFSNRSLAVGRALMTGAPDLARPLNAGAVLLTAILMNIRFSVNADPMTPVERSAPWLGLGDVVRILLKRRPASPDRLTSTG